VVKEEKFPERNRLEESVMLNLVNQQTAKKKKGQRKEQLVLNSNRKRTSKITGIRKYISIITPEM
jgi:hypothetical protein